MAVTERQKIIKKLYDDKVADKLFKIVEWRILGTPNSKIAERLGIHAIEFSEMVDSEDKLKMAFKKAEDLIADDLESILLGVARKGNVSAIKEMLSALLPEKYGKKDGNGALIQKPTIELKIGDASRDKEDLQQIVKDLEDKLKIQQGNA